MFYIIQTNINLDNNSKPQDFQSFIYRITKQTWEQFKDYIISNEKFTTKLIRGTIQGYTKPRNCIIEEILINDDFHLEVRLSYGENNHIKANSKYYMITEKQFSNLL